MIDEDQLNWDLKLDTILMGYRASKQGSTKQSPYYMLYEQHMRLSIDSEVLPKADLQGLCDQGKDQTDEAVEALLQLRQKAFNKAEVNIASAQRNKRRPMTETSPE